LNQSLPGLMYRMITHSPSVVDDKAAAPQFDNVLDLDPRTAGWLLKACMAAFAGAIVWSCRTSLSQRQGWRIAAEFSLVVLGMLLFSERTWKHHCVTLILPFAVLTYYLAIYRLSAALRGYLFGSLALSFLLITSTSSTGFRALAFLDEAGKRAHIYGAYTWAYLVLAAALIVLLRRSREGVVKRNVLAEEQTSHQESELAAASSAMTVTAHFPCGID
jgi:hypothetical protein